MPESGLVSTLSSSQLPPSSHHHPPPPPGDHPHHNLNYGNINNNSSNTQYFNSNNISQSQYMNRSLNAENNNHQPPTPEGSHSFLNSNDQNNNSNNNANDGPGDSRVGPPRGMPPDRRDLFEEIRNGGGHWSQLLRQVVFHPPGGPEGQDPSTIKDEKSVDLEAESQLIPIDIDGGSENGQFTYVGQVTPDINAWIAVGYLQPGDILLDIQGQQVAGYTQADVISLLHHCLRGNSVTLTVAPRGSLGPELRSYLNTRFQKGSVDHALQGVVRDNLYLRTVPVTTRQPRPGEINGVDYTFLSVEEFMELERNGSLLESGVYAGNHYGTPKPWASRSRSTNSQFGSGDRMQSLGETSKGAILPGIHPSSEGKRRRNRSNVEALGAGDDETNTSNINSPALPPTVTYSPRFQPPEDELGPLPSNWEMAYTEKGEVYFIDHNTGTSHWLDPRLSRVQKMTLEDCDDNELPFGWERIDDPHYGTYYIDHVNRRTQFENPVLQAKQAKSVPNSPTDSGENMGPPRPHGHAIPPRYSSANPPPPNPKPTNANRLSIPRGKTPVEMSPDQHLDSQSTLPHINHSTMPSMSSSSGLRVKNADRQPNRFFTRDPTQLVGERISTTLVKSSRGLGFTIVGGDDDDGLDEFLQIKSVVADGPAWRDGKLRTGDVLVRVNGRCVLGYTHQEMVSIFQSIAPGEGVHLEVCRGYPLPFDPADPNTEIVTTVAVAPFNPSDNGEKRPLDWMGRPSTPDSLAHSAHSLPELSGDRIAYGKSTTGRPASVDLLLDSPPHMRSDKGFSPKQPTIETGTFLTVAIVKGTAGFGFTIADSVTGQKVKKVLDSTHCGGLEEGDRLIAIDGIDLRGLSHTQVVQILKDFPLGRDASLTIQRIHSQPSYNKKFSPVSSNNYSDPRLISSRPGMSPRSKTPTAELGRGRPKLRDNLPDRPKTPVFDSGGQYNGQGGMYNGDVPHNQPNQMHLQNSHAYMPAERYPTSPVGVSNHTDSNFLPGDLNQTPIIRDWVDMTVELQRRQEGFGFRIVGGTEEGSQVSVGHIVPRGAAALDGRLQTNDQLVAVDSISVIGASHHSVVQLMARAASAHRVRLTIRRPVYGNAPAPAMSDGVASPSHSPAISSPPHVTLKRQPSEGFGFVIISSASKAGATIGRIVEGSPADRCGQLHVGDRILAVNQTEISQLHHSQVVQLIKDSGLVLTLTVLPVTGNENSIQQQPQLSPSNPSNMIAADLENLGLKENQGYDMGTAFIHPESQPVHFGSNHSGSSSYPDSVEQVFSVHLSRGGRGFGFSIRGGKEFQNMPLFVLRLAEGGPAAVDGRMQVGDQILQINAINTQGMTHSQAIHLIKTGGSSVHLLLRRGAVPIPYLNQMPNFSSGGAFGTANGHEEEQSVSSNNDPQFVGQTSPVYREHQHNPYPSQM